MANIRVTGLTLKDAFATAVQATD